MLWDLFHNLINSVFVLVNFIKNFIIFIFLNHFQLSRLYCCGRIMATMLQNGKDFLQKKFFIWGGGGIYFWEGEKIHETSKKDFLYISILQNNIGKSCVLCILADFCYPKINFFPFLPTFKLKIFKIVKM